MKKLLVIGLTIFFALLAFAAYSFTTLGTIPYDGSTGTIIVWNSYGNYTWGQTLGETSMGSEVVSTNGTTHEVLGEISNNSNILLEETPHESDAELEAPLNYYGIADYYKNFDLCDSYTGHTLVWETGYIPRWNWHGSNPPSGNAYVYVTVTEWGEWYYESWNSSGFGGYDVSYKSGGQTPAGDYTDGYPWYNPMVTITIC
jgi:hypothetical protein